MKYKKEIKSLLIKIALTIMVMILIVSTMARPCHIELKENAYKAKLIKVVDGDTQDFKVKLGFNIYTEIRVRILELDTPEIRGKEKELGLVYRRAAKSILSKGDITIVLPSKGRQRGKYGRWLVDIYAGCRDYKEVLKKEVKKLLKKGKK